MYYHSHPGTQNHHKMIHKRRFLVILALLGLITWVFYPHITCGIPIPKFDKSFEVDFLSIIKLQQG